MRRRLPPLAAIRPFEAAARLGSFTAAAEELAVTQGAISLQIRNLEEFLDKKLFERKVRKIDLTEDGYQYFIACQRALDELDKATARITSRSTHEILTVSALPTLATLWLMPKLASFTSTYREIEVRIDASINPVDLHNGNIDIALRCGKLPGKHYRHNQPHIDLTMTERWDGIQADHLFDDKLLPVISTRLLGQGPKLEKPADLLKYTLVHTASRPGAWRDWLHSNGIALGRNVNALEYGHFFIALQAAHEAKGVAIVPEVLFSCAKDRMPDLVAPFAAEVLSAGEYYVLAHESKSERKAVRLFRKWLLSQRA
jgi:LysR family glycine cleavage system transcriptional activator